MEKKDLSEFGAEARRQIGEQTDNEIFEFIKHNPGNTEYTISRDLGWSIGKTQGALNRLIDNSKIKKIDSIQNGRRIVKIYEKNYQKDTPGRFLIDSRLLSKNSSWGDKVHIYAKSRSTIIISPEHKEQWLSTSLFHDLAKPKQQDTDIEITVPDKLVDFYQLQNADYEISSLGNTIMITILSTSFEITSNEQTKPMPNSTINPGKERNVLVIEDDPTVLDGNVRLLNTLYEKYGINPNIEKLRQLKINTSIHFDVYDDIIVDPQLQQNVNGFLQMVKLKQENMIHARLIALSGNPYDQDDIEAAKIVHAVLLNKGPNLKNDIENQVVLPLIK